MKKLIIAEKPSVAGNIAEATGGGKRENGYIEGDHYIITWVFGHLLQLYDAVDYDEKMAGSWKMEMPRPKLVDFGLTTICLSLIRG